MDVKQKIYHVRFLFVIIPEEQAKIVFTMMNGNKAKMTDEEKKANEAQAWMCTTYYLTKKGYSDEVVATVGIMGAIDGPLQGAAVGAAFGGVAGFAMGAIIGA